MYSSNFIFQAWTFCLCINCQSCTSRTPINLLRTSLWLCVSKHIIPPVAHMKYTAGLPQRATAWIQPWNYWQGCQGRPVMDPAEVHSLSRPRVRQAWLVDAHMEERWRLLWARYQQRNSMHGHCHGPIWPQSQNKTRWAGWTAQGSGSLEDSIWRPDSPVSQGHWQRQILPNLWLRSCATGRT